MGRPKTELVGKLAEMEPRGQSWSLPLLMEGLHERVERDLRMARESIGHPGGKGVASEDVWLSVF